MFLWPGAALSPPVPRRAAPRRPRPPSTSAAAHARFAGEQLDVQTADAFDNAYYTNLLQQRGLLHSDQELFNGGSQDALVRTYSTNPSRFNADFVTAMIKMGNIMLAAGTATEIRLNCRRPN